ncbi:11S globulin seed storage protein 1 [Linum perenne]
MVENIGDPSRPDVFTPEAGRVRSVNSHDLPVLRWIQLSTERGVLYNWHFYNKIYGSCRPFPLETVVENLCAGGILFGSYWDHVLEYQEESKAFSEKVMFIKYKDFFVTLNRTCASWPHLWGDLSIVMTKKKLRRLYGEAALNDLRSWTLIYKIGKPPQAHWVPLVRNSYFFRRGQVGDW